MLAAALHVRQAVSDDSRMEAAAWVVKHTSRDLIDRLSRKPVTPRVVIEWLDRFGGQCGTPGFGREGFIFWKEGFTKRPFTAEELRLYGGSTASAISSRIENRKVLSFPLYGKGILRLRQRDLLCGTGMKNHPEHDDRGKVPAESELLTPSEAAQFLRLSESSLAKARMRGDGPRYRKLFRAVRYTKIDLETWSKARAKNSTSEP